MDKTTLKQRRSDLENRYNELQKKRAALDEEMLLLRGEYRLASKLLDEFSDEEKPAMGATKIEVQEAEVV